MKTGKLWLLGGISVVALGATWFLTNTPAARPAAQNASGDDSAPSDGHADELGRLQEAVLVLTARLRQLEGAAHAKQAQQKEVVPATRQHENEPKFTPPSEEDYVEARKQAMERLAEYDLEFSAEPVDTAWANEMEGSLASVFEGGDYGDTTVESIKCRKSSCRMEVSHGDVKSSREFEEIRHGFEGSYFIQHSPVTEDGASSTVLYVVRRGYERENPAFAAKMAEG